MLITVTGATGHIGGNLVRSLLAQGKSVRALALAGEDLRSLQGLDVEIVTGDVRDAESLRRAFDGAEVVYHMAAYISLLMSDWPLLEAINVGGTRNVIEGCMAGGVRRLVYFSSIEALADEPPQATVSESSPLAESRHYPPYARSKAAAEKEVRQAIGCGLDAVIIYPTGVVGPHDYRPSFFGQVLLDFAGGKMPALIEGGFNWVDVRDVVAGAVCAEENAPMGGRYILGGNWISVCDMAALIEDITGVKPPSFVSPMWLARLGAPLITALDLMAGKRPVLTTASLKPLRGYRHISHDLAARDLGHHPRPFKETVVDTLQWFIDNGRLSRPLLPPYDRVRREQAVTES